MEPHQKSANRCPKCNLKWRYCRCGPKHKKSLIDPFALFCVVSIMIIALVALWAKQQTATSQHATKKATTLTTPPSPSGKKIHALETEYFRKKIEIPDLWWLDSIPKNPEDPVFHEKITSRGQLVSNILGRFRKVSPRAEIVYEKFNAFGVSIFIGGKASIAIGSPDQIKQARVEICFVPRDHATALEKSINAPSSLYWRSDWGVFVNAVEMPYTVFAGLLFHELGHGSKHPVSLTGEGYFSPDSDAYAAEEIEMHELETKVFNEASQGVFEKTLKEIVLRNPKVKNVGEAIAQVTVDDLVRLDLAIGADKAGIETSTLVFAHYLIAVGTTYLDTHKMGIPEKIKMFRFLHREVLDIPVHLK